MAEFLAPRTREQREFQRQREVFNVTRKPGNPRDTSFPREGVKNLNQQADLLFLPETRQGYKFLLVVIDNGTRELEAEPLKDKTPSSVLNAFKRMYSRSVLSRPSIKLRVDAGTEFRGQVEKYFVENGTQVDRLETGNSRGNSLVEAANKQIGAALNRYLLSKELDSGKLERNWLPALRPIINALNSRARSDTQKHVKKERKKIEENPKGEPLTCKGKSCELLLPGTKVRVAAYVPKDITGARLGKDFRVGDIRFGREVKTITNSTINRGQQPLYEVDNNKNTLFPRAKLQVVSEDEVRGKSEPVEVKKAREKAEKLAFEKAERKRIDEKKRLAKEKRSAAEKRREAKKKEKKSAAAQPKKLGKKEAAQIVKIVKVVSSGRRPVYEVQRRDGKTEERSRQWLIANGYKELINILKE